MKAQTYLLIFAFLSIFNAQADNKCLYSIKDTTTAKVTWTAYKTPKKVAVQGSFDKIEYKSTESEDLKSFLLSSSIEINTESVNSGNKERDEKLVKFFFGLMKKKVITAKIQNVNEKNLLVLLTMNGVKKEITMDYTFENNILKLSADIDVINWSLNKPLASINKACAALHENKTWSDVNISATIPVFYECSQKI